MNGCGLRTKPRRFHNFGISLHDDPTHLSSRQLQRGLAETDGSLEIPYKGVRKIIFRDTDESVAETVFVDYVFPIPHEIAQDIVAPLTSHQGIDYQNALQSAIADYGLRPDDIDSVKRHLKTLLPADGFDTSELDEVGVEGC